MSGDESSKPPAGAGRPWPPLGPDTPWWREATDADADAGADPPEDARADPAAAAPRPAPPPQPTPPPQAAPLPASMAVEAEPVRRHDDDGEDASLIEVLASVPTAPDDDTWPAANLRPPTQRRFRPPVAARRPPKHPRKPALGLAGLLIFALVAAFLAWYAAGPLWLSLGHGRRGVATVVSCPVDGLSRRCADFVAEDGAFTAHVALLGPAGAHPPAGAILPARMVNADASTAYTGDGTSLRRRWGPSVALLVLCGFGIAWATGASRLPRARARWTVRLVSLLAPALLLAGMLAATY